MGITRLSYRYAILTRRRFVPPLLATLARRNLEIERVALAAMSSGIARRCIEEMAKYSSTRMAFGKPIGEVRNCESELIPFVIRLRW